MSQFNVFITILKDSFNIFCKYPVLILPLLISWIIYAYTLVYFNFDFNFKELNFYEFFALAFCIISFYCVVFSVASFILLEMIEHIETARNPNFFKALFNTFSQNFIKALPITLAWALIWFLTEIIEAITKDKKNIDFDIDYNDKSYSNIAKTISGYKEFSLSSLTLDLISSGVRMVVFYIYPAIAWENETTFNAIKKGFVGIKNNYSNFVTSFFSIEIVAGIIFIPVGLMILFSDKLDINYPVLVWQILIIYICCVFSYYLYLQQMMAAILYLWNMKWQKAVNNAINNQVKIPKLSDIERPSLLDNIPDLF